MVELTLSNVLQILQTTGILVGIIYYITIMRNQQKSRRSEILKGFLDERSNEEDALRYAYIMNLEWENYDDFQERYGRASNPEAWVKWKTYLVRFDDYGLMLKRGLINIEDFYELSERAIPSLWKKFEPIILEDRRRGNPTTMKWLEYLVEEMHRESKRRGDNMLPL